MKIEIAILNFNGKKLLEQCLPSILEAVKVSEYECKVVVVDNCSTDDSEKSVASNFPEVMFCKAKENKVLCSFNEVAERSTADVMLFLNNDLIVDKNFIDPLIATMKSRDNVFLSSARVYNFDGTDVEEGRTIPRIKWGVFQGVSKYGGYEEDLDRTMYTLQAGFGAFDRKKFLKLGGYDSLYLPGILEDTDIGFSAWRRGYLSIYNPSSHIFHMGKVSFTKRFGNRKLLAISHRNGYYFVWKNIQNKFVLAQNVLLIPFRLIYSMITLKWEIAWGIMWFLISLPKVFKARKKCMKNRDEFIMKDLEIINAIKSSR